jgi:hypothetical protein
MNNYPYRIFYKLEGEKEFSTFKFKSPSISLSEILEYFKRKKKLGI